MRIILHNTLTVPLRLYGLQDRSDVAIDSTVIAPGGAHPKQLFGLHDHIAER